MQTVLYVLLALVALLLILLAVAAVRAAAVKAAPAAGKSALSPTEADGEKCAAMLSRMVAVPSISSKGPDDLDEFRKLQHVMEELFPLIHKNTEKIDIAGNLLFRWKGRDSARAILFMGHQDVVPATEPDWKYPAFSGKIADGRVYGRGALDCKSTVMCEFAAVEELIAAGFVPETDVYLACSVNEETSGGGAGLTVERLKALGVRPEIVMDEGGMIVEKVMPGMSGMSAVIGVLEKGYMDVKVIARSAGGHSSTPPRNSPFARLSAFVDEMERVRPFKKYMSPTVKRMLERLAPRLSFPMRLLFANLWLFTPLLTLIMPKLSSYGEALLATTFAFTMSGGSGAPNIIPSEAYLICNLRISRHQNADESLAVLKKYADKHGLELEVIEKRNSSGLVNTKGKPYKYLEKCIAECMPDVSIVPYLIMGGTDCREYEAVSDTCVRFAPIRADDGQMAATHGVNENISSDALAEGMKFYRYFIENYA